MTSLQNNMRVVMQLENQRGSFHCLGFAQVPIINPVRIIITTWGLQGQAATQRDALFDGVRRAIAGIHAGVTRAAEPCGGQIDHFTGCHAGNVNDCRDVLVIVADGTQPLPADPFFGTWIADNPILVVAPANVSLQATLPQLLSPLNASQWTNRVTECVPDVLQVAGIDSDRRLFISYRRPETLSLANQLFDHLSRAQFDVFVDRFSIPPGVDFQARLTEELADKSMVVALESPSIMDSQWTTYEIEFAKAHSLGLLAVKTPDTQLHQEIPGVDSSCRLSLNPADAQPDGTLTAAALERTLARIRDDERTAKAERLRKLRSWLAYGLDLAGVRWNLRASGIVEADTPRGDNYGVWTNPRPPRPDDFHRADTADPGILMTRRVVLAPAPHEHGSRAGVLSWISDRTGVAFYDLSEMGLLIDDIAQNRL